MKVKLLHIAVAAAALLGATAATAAPVVVSFAPSSMNVAVGGPYSIDINISGLGSQIVSAFDLNIKFNPAVVGSFTYSLGAGLGGPWDSFEESVPPSDFGVHAYSLTQLDSDIADLQTDDAFTLMTLDFMGLADGVSALFFGNSPDFELNLVGRDGRSLEDVSFGRACIAVGQGDCRITVPEPATYALIGVALAGALVPGFLRRRRTATCAQRL
jgi:hypothetical protein